MGPVAKKWAQRAKDIAENIYCDTPYIRLDEALAKYSKMEAWRERFRFELPYARGRIPRFERSVAGGNNILACKAAFCSAGLKAIEGYVRELKEGR